MKGALGYHIKNSWISLYFSYWAILIECSIAECEYVALFTLIFCITNISMSTPVHDICTNTQIEKDLCNS